MSKSLLIVESPTKARTLNRYLGKNFVVKASVGHVKDLPETKLGIDIENQFRPEYQVIRGKKKVLKELKDAAEKADAIYLGPDPDREGEAIAWHIAEELDTGHKPVHRVLFYELTHKAIQEALKKPEPLNRSLYDAQQARRILDRLVGYLISPLLWEKVKRGLSAGRVQSVALRLVCEREREIQRFVPEEYWTVTARMAAQEKETVEGEKGEPKPFEARLWRCRRKKCELGNEEETRALVEILKGLSYQVASVERKKRFRKPAPPFITSTLQQEAARKLRFTAKRTMSIAQRLYEGVELGDEGAVGLITYMRTDSTRLSEEAVNAAREYIGERWGSRYLPGNPVIYKAKGSAQDAHEAIRPTDVRRTPEAVAPFLSKEQLALYSLIWSRFVACQMASAQLAQTTIDISGGDFIFRVTGSIIEFPGFMVLYVEGRDDNEEEKEGEAILPELQVGQAVDLLELLPKQHFTQPPPRFTEATLIKELEERGVGRPSTYAAILSTIIDRQYVSLARQRLHPTELGLIINDLLVKHFPEVVDVDFTAKMEKNLDEVEQGRHPSQQLLVEFYDRFSKTLAAAASKMQNLRTEGLVTGLDCPRCGRPLLIKFSRNGPFVTCSGYPECTFSSNYERDEKGGVRLLEDTVSGEVCDKCGRPMVVRRGRYGEFLACSGYPECKNTRPVSTGIPCPREGCEGELVERMSKKGRKFFGCNKYPECKMVFWDLPVRRTCPQCGSPVMIEKNTKKEGKKWICPRPGCGYQAKE